MADIVKINHNTWRIEDGVVRFYLFCGTDRAALIDTGMNVPDARKIAESITSLPLILINTHGDPDHISGNGAFNEVFMSAAEEDNYRIHGGTGKVAPVKEGVVIDLGNRPLEVVDIPGHTPGSIALLDLNNRILVSGDSVQDGNIFMFGQGRDLRVFRESLGHLEEFDGLYDTIYPMHGTFPVYPDLVGKLKNAASDIIDGKASSVPVSVLGQDASFFKFEFAGFLCEPQRR